MKRVSSFALEGAVSRFAELGRAVGAAKEVTRTQRRAAGFLLQYREMITGLEIPTLQEYGIDREAFIHR